MVETIQAVVFDMDGVLCTYDFERRLSHLTQSTGLPQSFIRETIWDSGFDDEADQGRHSAADYLTGFQKRLGVPLSRENWIAARAASMKPKTETLNLARKTASRVPVAMLTNNGLLLKEALPGIFPELIDIFGERAYFSAELGLAKPDPAAFQAVAHRLSVAPEHMMFIDDGALYLEGARKAGLYGHHFSSASNLEAELTTFDLL